MKPGRNKQHKEGEPLTRRNFLQLGGNLLAALAGIQVLGIGLSFLRPREEETGGGAIIRAGKVEDFQPGSVTEFDEERFYLIREQEGGFLALYRRCPHLGCSVQWHGEDESFYCPCHASSFDKYGNFENAPVPRALDVFRVEIRDDVVFVDTTALMQRESFQREQLRFAGKS